jgi:hypothetical protein
MELNMKKKLNTLGGRNKIYVNILILVIFAVVSGCNKNSSPTGPNHSPSFPSPFVSQSQTVFQYDSNGKPIGAVTTIIGPSATDPDGDQLSYSWSVSNGSIVGNGNTAMWLRLVSSGSEQTGTATLTVSDGRGGIDYHTFQF